MSPKFVKIAKISLLLGLTMPAGCGKIYNSSTFDSSTYGVTTGSAQFLAAKAVINTHCSTCHTRASHEAWAGMGEADFVSQGLVTPRSLEGSSIYTKIMGNRTAITGNMPQGGAPLNDEELTVMENWIQGMTL
jgi:uncharacterized membrane protein